LQNSKQTVRDFDVELNFGGGKYIGNFSIFLFAK